VRVDRQPTHALLGAHLRPPRLRPGGEERLRLLRRRGHRLTGGAGPFAASELARLPPGRPSAEVADVLTDRASTVDVLALVAAGRDRSILLSDERIRALLEQLPVRCGPPVDEVAGPVVA